MLKKLLITIAGLVVVLAFLAGVKGMQIGALIAASKNFAAPAEAVTTAEVRRESWRPAVTAVGTVAPVRGSTLSTEVAGLVAAIRFESGSLVKEGDVLVELDRSTEEAQLCASEAGADLAKINLARARELREKNTISQSELDAAKAQAKQTFAQVDSLRASIAKKTLRAPFDGRLGIRQVNLGQFLNPGSAIVTLQSVDTVYVNFYLPQQQLDKVGPGLEVRVGFDGTGDRAFSGSVTAVAPEVEQATRNVLVQATLPNPDGALRPGMFVNVSVLQSSTRDVLVVPATAILYASYGNSVFVAEKSKEGDGLVAVQRFVRLGETRGDFVEVVEGLTVGDPVVTNGGFKLRNNAAITLQNDRAPAVQLNPKPSDT